MGTQIYVFDSLLVAGAKDGEVGLTDPPNARVIGAVLFALHDLADSNFAGYEELEDLVNDMDPSIEAAISTIRTQYCSLPMPYRRETAVVFGASVVLPPTSVGIRV